MTVGGGEGPVCLMGQVLWVNKHSADARGAQAQTFSVESEQMVSRLTDAVGRRGRLLGESVIKGPVFTKTQPLRHIKLGHRRPLAPGSAAPTTATCAEPGSTHKAGHHGVLPRAATRPRCTFSPLTPPLLQFGTVNTLTPSPAST